MSRLVALALADRARRRCLLELAIGRRRAGEARRLLEQLALELGEPRARHATTTEGGPWRRLAAEPGKADATPRAGGEQPTIG